MESIFFLIVPNGLEELAFQELNKKWPIFYPGLPLPIIKIVKGGLELTTDYSHGVMLNYFLKIPTRILLRVTNFKVRDFPKLYNKIRKIEWKLYLKNEFNYSIKVTCHKSRLNLLNKIEKTVQDGISFYFKANPPKKNDIEFICKNFEFTLFVLIENDNCQISVDTTGFLLYKRGYKKYSADASIRETLASALYFNIENYLLDNEIYTLVDPMCGSGTLLFESLLFYTVNIDTKFAFNYFKTKVDQTILNLNSNRLTPFKNYFGFDISQKNIDSALLNLKNIDTTNANFIFKEKDLFKLTTNDINNNQNLVFILNPPYGKRIEIDSKNDTKFFQNIIETIFNEFNPILVGIIIPSDVTFSSKKVEILSKTKFKNGGIPVTFYVLKSI